MSIRNNADDATPDLELTPGGEYIGAYSDPIVPYCCRDADSAEPCEQAATHTVVIRDDDGLQQIAACDAHGEPQDATPADRIWLVADDAEGER